jgi:hypothetical protein
VSKLSVLIREVISEPVFSQCVPPCEGYELRVAAEALLSDEREFQESPGRLGSFAPGGVQEGFMIDLVSWIEPFLCV